MHADHRLAPVPHRVHRGFELQTGHPARPGRQVGRVAQHHGDAHLGQGRLEVLLDRLHARQARRTVDLERKPVAVDTGLHAGRIEQLRGLGEVEVVALHVGAVERAAAGDRPGGALDGVARQTLDDEVTINREGDGLAYALVGQLGVLEIEGHPQQRTDRGRRDLDQLRARHLADARRVGARHLLHRVDLAGLEGQQQAGGILELLEDEPVQPRLVLQEEAVEALEHQMLSRPELDELERPRADRRRIAGVGLQVGAGEHVGRHDGRERGRHRQQQRRVRFSQAHHGGVAVRDGHRVQRPVHRGEGMVVAQRLETELDVLGGDGPAVVEDRITTQLQRDASVVDRQLEALGQVGLRLPLGVHAQRRGEQLRGRAHRGDA